MDAELKAWQAEIERRIERLEGTPASPPRLSSSKPTSVGEFLQSKGPRNGLEKSVVVAYHIEKLSGKGAFTLADIRLGFREAKEPLPVNSRDLVHKAIKKGWMMEAGGPKRDGFRSLMLTNSGEQFVQGLKSG
ncbi:MAG: hypothetical protein L3K19_00260 [Thermoplasmata archaeon]|nr:hypothetical protein [Thermoplasmata archaeon]